MRVWVQPRTPLVYLLNTFSGALNTFIECGRVGAWVKAQTGSPLGHLPVGLTSPTPRLDRDSKLVPAAMPCSLAADLVLGTTGRRRRCALFKGLG